MLLLLNFAVCNSRKLKCINQLNWLLSFLEIKTPFNEIPLLGSILF